MPDFWSHQLAAKSIRETLMNDHINVFDWGTEELALFYLGAQGPDLFYYINKFTPYKKRGYKDTGDTLHNSNPQKLMQIMIETAFQQSSKGVNAYLYGFVSHYFLDAYCHPIICKLGPDSESHKRVEMDFEALCINRYWKENSKGLRNQFFTVIYDGVKSVLEPFWNSILASLNLNIVPSVDYKSGVKDLHRIEQLLVNKLIDRLPFKNIFGRLFHYNLSLLQFPEVTEQLADQLDYNAFIIQYELGMAHATEALSELISLTHSNDHIVDYVSKWINKNFLGEDLKDVQ